MAKKVSKSKVVGLASLAGKGVFVRTVTHYYIGVLRAVYPTELELSSASWIASSGRWADALAKGVLDEVEPYQDGPVYIGRGAIIDVSIWAHALPRSQK